MYSQGLLGRGQKESFSNICLPLEVASLGILKDILRIWAGISVQCVPASGHLSLSKTLQWSLICLDPLFGD